VGNQNSAGSWGLVSKETNKLCDPGIGNIHLDIISKNMFVGM
jgi:hypothetical protein